MTSGEGGKSGKGTGDRDLSRRRFLKAALASGIVLVLAGIAAVAKSLIIPSSPPPALAFPKLKVANVGDLRVNKPLDFNYPLENTPNLLVKLGEKAEGGIGPDGDIVAFSQICQHLGCIYGYVKPDASPGCDSSYAAPRPVGYCCCHGSIYDYLHDAKVLGGPSPRPVPRVILELDSSTGDIYATGMTAPTIFGHHTGSDDVSYDLQGGAPVG